MSGIAAATDLPVPRVAATERVIFGGSLVASGVCFVLYPAIRPFSSEVGYPGARAFGSSSWVVAHSLGIIGFVLLALGTLGIYVRLRQSAVAPTMLRALLFVWTGVGLTLPYYGAEVFGLHAVGQRALAADAPSLVEPLTHDIRLEAGIYFIIVGLVLLAIGAVMAAIAAGRSGVLARWSGVPLAVALVLYIPQFAAGQPVRVAHGCLMLIGCWWLAREVTQE
jgi:hypothetical protein